MSKLLRAHFARLWKEKPFLIICALMFLGGVLLPLKHYWDNVRLVSEWALDDGAFAYAMVLSILSAVFTSLFVGTEHSNSTMRNQLVVGHRRSMVYLSNLVVCVAGAAFLSLCYLVPYVGVGIMLLGPFACGAAAAILFALTIFALMTAVTALFTAIAMLCQNKAYSAVACILLAFVLLLAGIGINSALNEPEYYSAYSYTENGVTVSEDMAPNSNYLTGTKREIYAFLDDFLPGGQSIQLSGMKAEHLGLLSLYDLAIFLAATGCGLLLFKRKDLK